MLVVAAALLDPAGRCLMQQRPTGKRHAGLWEFPGGKVEPGEAPAAALVRELAEELAICVPPETLVPLSFASDAADGAPPLVMLLYVARTWTGEPQPLAAAALRWDVPDALAGLPMPPVDAPLLAVLRDSLARGGAVA
ncbi:(deoxy)nucleoside triphosphate pyrophosphohydrolase [Sphingomonas sp. DT-51]|uniref:(deoxy)nucleoside triphosphate pyrophosphohydrolase n=1 Tax=Sphingomonas sp. DT-51 TaxID=3396165 RepID=UPI003F1A1C9A